MKSLLLKSPAKLNLYLKILKRRPDGFHQIESVFERIDLCDTIFLKKREKGILINCDNKDVPLGASNSAYKAAKELKNRLNLPLGVEIKIKKRIPIGSGLGGASSNAATVLKGLNKLWDLGLSKKFLLSIAEQIGSDICFFLYDCKKAVVRGKGEKISPLSNSQPLWFLIVTPNFKVSTKAAYGLWDRYKRLDLTVRPRSAKMLLHILKNKDWQWACPDLFNDFEDIIGSKYNIIYDIKEKLQKKGAKAASMSGTGSSVFGLFPSRKEAGKAKRAFSGDKRWQAFMARTY